MEQINIVQCIHYSQWGFRKATMDIMKTKLREYANAHNIDVIPYFNLNFWSNIESQQTFIEISLDVKPCFKSF